MSTVPDKQADRIQWYQAHIAPWTSNSTAIGTSSSAVTDLNTKVTAAQSALATATAARESSKGATTALDEAIRVMSIAGAAIIKQIRAKGEITGGDSVYSLAQIPPPAVGSPKPPPGPVTDFKVTLNGNGALDMTWKCINPPGATGTMYQVWRRIGASGAFTYIGGSGVKEFTDDSAMPTGTTSVTYQLQAVRSTQVGPWTQFNVVFGASSEGMTIASVVEGTPAKIAA